MADDRKKYGITVYANGILGRLKNRRIFLVKIKNGYNFYFEKTTTEQDRANIDTNTKYVYARNNKIQRGEFLVSPEGFEMMTAMVLVYEQEAQRKQEIIKKENCDEK